MGLSRRSTACATAPDDPASIAVARQRLTVEHPLQPFSAEYFLAGSDVRRRSFHAEYCRALQHGLTASAATSGDVLRETEESGDEAMREASLPFFTRPLAPPAAEWRQVSIDQLLQFFRNPCRVLLRRRLNLALSVADEELLDDEPFLADYRGRRAFAQRILPLLLAGRPQAQVRELALAGNEYPAGRLGERLIDEELARLQGFADELAPQLAIPPLPPVHAAFDCPLAGEPWQLVGVLGDLRPTGLLRYRYDEVRAADRLAGWISHLVLCAAAPPAVRLETYWHARDGGFRLRPCEAAAARTHLAALVALYRRGLSQPLHFFPRSAWAYVEHGGKLTAARQHWHNQHNPARGEEADPAFQLALRGVDDPLDAEFEHCARTVFGPLLEHLEALPN